MFSEAVVEAIGVCKSFSSRRGQSVPVLKDVRLSAFPGQMTGIVGPSGCGKSTLLYCLSGLEPVTSGGVRVLGKDITGLGATRSALFRRQNLGFMFQAYNLVSSMSVEANVRLPFTLRHERVPMDRIHGLLERFGIYQHRHDPVETLSGGEQQRVALVRVLAADPPVVFADEPTGALDQEMGGLVIDELRRVASQPDRAVVVVTHSAQVASVCDVVYTMLDGQVVGRSGHNVETLTGEG